MSTYENSGEVGTVHELGDGRTYVVGDALDVLDRFGDEASAIFLDDGWTRPQGVDHLDMNYDAHPFEGEASETDASGVTTTDILDACYDALADGGWLIASAEDYRDDHAEDWVLPRLVEYLRREWGDVAQNYDGGGFRKVGGVTYLTPDDEPDTDTSGAHLSSGGYPVVFAHKGRSDRESSVSARQIAERPREGYGWNSVKPVSPYQKWVEALVEPGELVLVPCAGTAPAAIATERAFGDDARYVCIDTEEGAYDAFRRRREMQVEGVQ